MRIPFSQSSLARFIWNWASGAAGTTADRAVNTTYWNGTTVATPDTAGYPKVTSKTGTGTGEVLLSSGQVTVGTNNDKTGYGVSGVLKSVQYGQITFGAGSASGTATITAVTTSKAVVIYLGYTEPDAGTQERSSFSTAPWLTLTNATTVTATRSTGLVNGAGANVTGTVAFVVAEFN